MARRRRDGDEKSVLLKPVSLRTDSRARVRYLLALLAKEIVVRTTGRIDTAESLESLVEIREVSATRACTATAR